MFDDILNCNSEYYPIFKFVLDKEELDVEDSCFLYKVIGTDGDYNLEIKKTFLLRECSVDPQDKLVRIIKLDTSTDIITDSSNPDFWRQVVVIYPPSILFSKRSYLENSFIMELNGRKTSSMTTRGLNLVIQQIFLDVLSLLNV